MTANMPPEERELLEMLKKHDHAGLRALARSMDEGLTPKKIVEQPNLSARMKLVRDRAIAGAFAITGSHD